MTVCETWIADFRPLAERHPNLPVKVIPYSLDSRKGFMLRWNSSDAPALRMASPVRGWHEIHIGFWGMSGCRIRLAGDPWFDWVESTARWDWGQAGGEEALWKIADLTGASFEFLPTPFVRQWSLKQSQIAYLRLVPISESEARVRTSRRRPTRTAGAVIDGHEALGAFCPQSPDEVRSMIAPFIDSDFRRIHWCCTLTTMRMMYLTQVGYYLGQDQPIEKLHTEHNRRGALCLQKARQDGYDPLDVMIDFAARNDLELWASFRIQQDYPSDYSGGVGYDFNSPFVDAHPEWRHVDRQGNVCSHLFSHFHAGWEQYKLDLLAEIARKGPAGIHLNLACEFNFIWDFAPHAVAEFKRKYGIDPCAEETPPPEWYQFRCDHLTEFMRRLRVQTNQIASESGKRIPIAVQVSGDWSVLTGKPFGARTASANFMYGLDIARWAREGLVDIIAPSFRRDYRPMFLDHIYEELGEARKRIELAPSIGQFHEAVLPRDYDWSVYFTDVGKGRSDLLPFVEIDPWRMLRQAHDLYQQGADSVDVWEMGEAFVPRARWNILKHIGDRDLLAREFGTRINGLTGKISHPLTFSAQ